jgi:ppGpp synthetase/RelA/SpoT-type nucleotidyltranferase
MARERTDVEWVADQAERFTRVRPGYVEFAGLLKDALEGAAAELAPLAIVQVRVKKVPSFAEKALRLRDQYDDPVTELTDLCGGRVIVHTPDEVKAVSDFIEESFAVDWDNSQDVSQRLKPAEFGYRSVHYIVSFRSEVPEAVRPLKGEVQVRTLLEHAWADFAHDRTYKSSFEVPDRWQRELAVIAAALESADRSFMAIHDGLLAYAASYGAYMTSKEMEAEIGILETVLTHDPENAELASRIGKLALARGDFGKAVEVLGPRAGSGHPAVLRDLGVALCKLHGDEPRADGYLEGRSHLERAVELAPDDVDALCSLAGTWRGIDEDRVRDLYRRAFELDPSDPYPLGNYLEREIIHRRDPSLARGLAPVVEAAIERCRQQSEVGVNLPWAYSDAGKFDLLLGRPYDGLAGYAKAIDVSSAEFMVAPSKDSLERHRFALDQVEGLEWVSRLRLLALAAKWGSTTAVEQLRERVSPGHEPISGPAVILAGGCDQSLAAEMGAYRGLLLEAFGGFQGTLVSGGTSDGISGLAGDIREARPDAVHALGYVPSLIPADATLDSTPDRYSEIRRTPGEGFSPLEPLQAWTDLIASGIEPKSVRLVGLDGGRIAAAEYRIALALGARVGLVEESGRAAARICSDPDWSSSELLVRLPADPQTLRAFVGGGRPPQLPPEIRERIARAIHDAYREAGSLAFNDPANAPWEELADDLKRSNLAQADDLEAKLREIGCVTRPAGRDVASASLGDAEVERLAEMEHGRWNVERLLAGWRWGAERDPGRRTNPSIAPWSKLSEEVKRQDRDAVAAIPALLAAVGYEVVRDAPRAT